MELTSERGEDDVPTLEGFPVDGPGTIFLVFLLGDPHLLKGVQGGEDRAPGMEGVQSNIVKECGEGYSWSLPGPMGPNQTRLLFKGWG